MPHATPARVLPLQSLSHSRRSAPTWVRVAASRFTRREVRALPCPLATLAYPQCAPHEHWAKRATAGAAPQRPKPPVGVVAVVRVPGVVLVGLRLVRLAVRAARACHPLPRRP